MFLVQNVYAAQIREEMGQQHQSLKLSESLDGK